jgi:hypothetical protein
MPLVISMLLVFGAVGIFIGNVALSERGELGFGFEQLIHARIPWLLLAMAITGASLGVFSLVRARRWYKWLIVPVELVLAGILAFYFTSYSFLPSHQLVVSVGDPFPDYSLVDQNGEMHAYSGAGSGQPMLYIFYRGDW